MHPADITAALKKAGTSQTAVARDAGVSQAAVWMVIAGQRTSRRVAEAIATAAGMSVEKLWPGRYTSRSAAREVKTTTARDRAQVGRKSDTRRAA